MLMNDLLSSGATPLLEKTLAFTGARHKMLVTNIANITTPGYRAKQLDVKSFQSALREAADKRGTGELKISSGREFRVSSAGLLEVTPTEEPPENVLFQDCTNARIEKEMASLAENTMVNQAAAELLKSQFGSVEKAIRGRAI